MEKIIFFIMLCTVVKARPDKLPNPFETYKKVACTSDNDILRNNIFEQAQCGEPKEVFHVLEKRATYEEVRPSAVWVKRCVGLCDYSSYGSNCVPTEIVKRYIPVRIFNAKTNKESCATYPIEEHKSCGCCAQSADDCPSPRVYVPRKCACQCPNTAERRACLSKRSSMRWNRYKCMCEHKRRKVQ